MLDNAGVARRLLEIRTLMEMAGETFYKYSAFEKAAASIENASPLPGLIAAGELTSVPGIGRSIAAVIEQLLDRGSADVLDALYERFPPTIVEVLGVSGIGTKTAAMLWNDYQIASLADLEAAITSGALEAVPRLGSKTIDNWRRGILAYKGRQRRLPLARAIKIATEAIAYLRTGPAHRRLMPAGSVRRQEATVGDVDLVCASDDAAAVTTYFAAWDRASAVLAEGPTKTSVWLENGFQIDLRVLPDHLFGNLLQHFTGSRDHNIKLREHAVRAQLRVSENGILDLQTGGVVTCAEEDGVYAALGMQYVPPELRSGSDEVELARAFALPELVELSDVRGDFHMHSTWSDGRDTLESMIAAAAARGYEYHAISDHSFGRGKRYGLDPADLLEQRKRVEELGKSYGIATLCASEVDLLPDGTLDYDDGVLAQLDIVIASVHSAFNISPDAMTRRLIAACENRYVSIIGHPTGRMLDGFPGYDFDHDAVFAAAARTGTALEIDGQALRLDLPAPLVRRAKTFGVTFTCDSDAHEARDLQNVELSVGQARRAGLTKDDVLNARDLADVRAFVQRKRRAP
ncbi:MAG: DNA polymerase/3'-5' exonuclease PolX [Candidatus Eremiobacteraeota bacterium]|nr:DNA polymerase/3'-5' exonuclease PolX [Candidatus Eremiobacteraeota bacterium]